MTLPAEVARWLAEHGVRATDVDVTPSGRALIVQLDGLVLRWYGVVTRGPEEPDAILREVASLTAVAASGIPVPRLVAWTDEPPALLMTRLDGKHRLDASGSSAVLEILDAIHATRPGGSAAWTYRGYHEGFEMGRPRWWREARIWHRALEISRQRPMAIVEPVLIHRDFHPGNLLWTGESVSGVVDWGDACAGPAGFDLAHYRVNIATLAGPEVADTTFPGDPGWDVEAGLSYLDPEALDDWVGPWPGVSPSVARNRLETFIGRALAALG